MGDPISFIKEGRANILNISELSEKQANVALAFYLQQLLKDRKDASIAQHGRTKRERNFKFNSPIFVIIEELMSLFQKITIPVQNTGLQKLPERAESLV